MLKQILRPSLSAFAGLAIGVSLLVCPAVSVAKEVANEASSQFAGSYREESRGTVLYLLPDQTFCIGSGANVGFVQGSGEAGRWRVEGKKVVLEEARPNLPVFPVYATKSKSRLPNLGRREFEFFLMHNAGLIFGLSNDGKLPSDMKPLFPSDQEKFSPFYSANFAVGKSTRLYLGRPLDSEKSQPRGTRKYVISEYVLTGNEYDKYRIEHKGASEPGAKMTAVREKDGLTISFDESTHVPFKMTADSGAFVDRVKENCIDPVLSKPLPPYKDFVGELLRPVREFEASLDLSKMAPVFTGTQNDGLVGGLLKELLKRD
jgi:hypothetical protein